MQKSTLSFCLGLLTTLCLWVLFIAITHILPTVHGQETVTSVSIPNEAASFLETPVFTESDQSDIEVSSLHSDGSTNVAFYMKCPSVLCENYGTLEAPVYIFTAENLGHGNQPFTDYWVPPIPNDYVAVEYYNDTQQFSCSGLTFEDCLADPRFIDAYYFTIVDDGTAITPEMRSAKDSENRDFSLEPTIATSTASDALLLLSISLSSTSISSNLDNGLIVTASLDGIMNVATSSIFDSSSTTSTESESTTSSSTETEEGSTVGSFIMDIVGSVIDIFTPEDTPSEEVPIEPAEETSATTNTTTTESALELPTPDPIVEEPVVTENEVQSSLSTDELPTNEVTTTTF